MGALTQTITNVGITVPAVNLTTVGLVDWASWGSVSGSLTAADWKSGAGHTIPNPTKLGSDGLGQFTLDPRTISWTDGTNTASTSNTDSIYTGGTNGDGFQIVLPADLNTRTVVLYLGGYNVVTGSSAASVTASLSDGSASTVTDNTTIGNASTNQTVDATVTLVYAANSAGQTCTFSITLPAGAGASIIWQAVAYQSVVAPAAATPTLLMGQIVT